MRCATRSCSNSFAQRACVRGTSCLCRHCVPHLRCFECWAKSRQDSSEGMSRKKNCFSQVVFLFRDFEPIDKFHSPMPLEACDSKRRSVASQRISPLRPRFEKCSNVRSITFGAEHFVMKTPTYCIRVFTASNNCTPVLTGETRVDEQTR